MTWLPCAELGILCAVSVPGERGSSLSFHSAVLVPGPSPSRTQAEPVVAHAVVAAHRSTTVLLTLRPRCESSRAKTLDTVCRQGLCSAPAPLAGVVSSTFIAESSMFPAWMPNRVRWRSNVPELAGNRKQLSGFLGAVHLQLLLSSGAVRLPWMRTTGERGRESMLLLRVV